MEVVPADDSCDVNVAEALSWCGQETECLTDRKDQDWCFVIQSKNGVVPVRATGSDI